MKETGRLLRIDLVDGGEGYVKPPIVEISPPVASAQEATTASSVQATARAYLSAGKAAVGSAPATGKSVERIEIIDGGAGYAPGEIIVVSVSPPPLPSGASKKTTGWVGSASVATARVVPEFPTLQQHRAKPTAGRSTATALSLKVISCAPAVFSTPNFLSPVEVRHLVGLASGKKGRVDISPSTVYAGGESAKKEKN